MNNYYLYKFQYKDNSENGVKALSATLIFCDLPVIEEGSLQVEIRAFYERHYQTDKIFVLGAKYAADELNRVFIKQQKSTFIGIPKKEDTHLSEHLHLLTFDKDGNIECLDGTETDAFEAKLINEGLQNIFINRGGLITSEGAHHFVFPSGKHCDKFLRTGNILLHSCEINFIAFALLGHFDENKYDQIYCDTSSINSVAFSLVQLKNRFLIEKEKKHIPISSFSSYQGLYKNDLSYPKNAFLLISASTSANIIGYILNHHRIIDRNNIVILFFLGEDWKVADVKDRIICNLTLTNDNPSGIQHYETFKENECKHCKRGSFAVEVAGDVFLLENPVVKPLLIEARDADRKLSGFVKQFISVNKSETILKVNYKENSKIESKYEIYIDYSRILDGIQKNKYKKYKAKLDNYIDQYVPSNTRYILSLNDSASKELAKYIQESICGNYLKKNIPKIFNQDLLSQEINKDVAGTIVVTGSCISNGKNLLYISRALRQYDKLRIVYFIGISRTVNGDYLDKLKKDLKYGQYGGETYTFVTIETLYCNNNSVSTSWVDEIQFLKKMIDFIFDSSPESADALSILRTRKKFLETSSGEVERGLKEQLFYPSFNTKNGELVIRKNFAFFNFNDYEKNTTQSDIYFTISNILNSLRNSADNKHNLSQSAYVRNVLAPSNFNRFNDGIIQASLLRAARPDELAYKNDENLSNEMYHLMETLIKYHEDEQGEGLMEFIYAIASKKLSLKEGHLKSVIEKLQSECKNELVNCYCKYMEHELLEKSNIISKKSNQIAN